VFEAVERAIVPPKVQGIVMNTHALLRLLVLSCFCAVFFGVAYPALAQDKTPDSATTSGMPRETGNNESYRLGTGDKIKLTVFGQDDLGGEFTVDDQGFIRLPLIGQVKAAGLTILGFEDAVTAKLADGYLRDPRVSVQVVNYRPFYIIGEVNKPGEYPYENGMNVLNAVSLAGGYTYRADDSVVYVRRKGSPNEEKEPADQTTIIYPGDIIRISERFF
jgi:protein involved in polysaccharide export with SLBB domain